MTRTAGMDGATGTSAGPMVPSTIKPRWWPEWRPGRRPTELPPSQPAPQRAARLTPAVFQSSSSFAERRPRGRVPVFCPRSANGDPQLPPRRSTCAHASVHGPWRARRPPAARQKRFPPSVMHRQVRSWPASIFYTSCLCPIRCCQHVPVPCKLCQVPSPSGWAIAHLFAQTSCQQ